MYWLPQANDSLSSPTVTIFRLWHLICNVLGERVVVVINSNALVPDISHIVGSEFRILPQSQTWWIKKFNTTDPFLYHKRCRGNWQHFILFLLFLLDKELFLFSLFFQINISPCGIQINTFKISMRKRVNTTYTTISPNHLSGSKSACKNL